MVHSLKGVCNTRQNAYHSYELLVDGFLTTRLYAHGPLQACSHPLLLLLTHLVNSFTSSMKWCAF